MPTSSQILDTLAELARTWHAFAVVWHLYFVAIGVLMIFGWRPLKPALASLLTAPLITVVVLAAISGNPFTAIVLGICVIAAIVIAVRLPRDPVTIAGTGQFVAGIVLALFGFVYPHFLDGVSWYVYLIAAPVGIVPCPTLSIIIGLALIVGGFESRWWAIVLGVAGAFYGVFGAVRLGVSLDWVLLAGAGLLLATAFTSSGLSRGENQEAAA
jgi:hypothetical protein